MKLAAVAITAVLARQAHDRASIAGGVIRSSAWEVAILVMSMNAIHRVAAAIMAREIAVLMAADGDGPY